MNTLPLSSTLLAAEPFTRTSTGEGVQFWILGAVAVIGALGVVGARKAVHSAIFLAMTMIILAVFYIAQGALFLGVVQVVVYTGAVMMLFLFVLMLVGIDSSESLVETLRGQRIAAIAVGTGFGLLLIGGLGNAFAQSDRFAGVERADDAPGGNASGGNVAGLAELIFIRYVWAFELTGVLLITATIGAMVLAHRERFEPRKDQREHSQERVAAWGKAGGSEQGGGQVTPLPSPGVYARHNSVDRPAMLPDGSFSQRSVSRVFHTPETVIPETPKTPEEEGTR